MGLDDCRVFVIPVISEGCDGEGQVLRCLGEVVVGCDIERRSNGHFWDLAVAAYEAIQDSHSATISSVTRWSTLRCFSLDLQSTVKAVFEVLAPDGDDALVFGVVLSQLGFALGAAFLQGIFLRLSSLFLLRRRIALGLWFCQFLGLRVDLVGCALALVLIGANTEGSRQQITLGVCDATAALLVTDVPLVIRIEVGDKHRGLNEAPRLSVENAEGYFGLADSFFGKAAGLHREYVG